MLLHQLFLLYVMLIYDRLFVKYLTDLQNCDINGFDFIVNLDLLLEEN